jgi:hypothetical protein
MARAGAVMNKSFRVKQTSFGGIMSKNIFLAGLVASISLSACGVDSTSPDGSSQNEEAAKTAIEAHEECVDQESTQEYSVAWQGELAELKQSGYFEVDEILDIQGDAYGKLHLLRDGEYSDFCNYLDRVRDEKF